MLAMAKARIAAVVAAGILALGATAASTYAAVPAEPDGGAAPPNTSAAGAAEDTTPAKALAEELLGSEGVRKGLCIHLGCGGGILTVDLHLGGKYLVHGLTSNREELEKARQYVRSRDVYGKVSVDCCSMRRLPYADNVANVIVAEDLPELRQNGLSIEEIMRVLAPYGVAFLKGETVAVKEAAVSKVGEWTKVIKPYPKAMDEWPQLTNDGSGAGISKDKLIGPLTGVRWVGGDVWTNRGEGRAMGVVSGNGRVFYQCSGVLRDGKPVSTLVCRDAFNGLLLWERYPEPPLQCVAAVGDRVYTLLKPYGGPVVALDAATGETVKTCDFSGSFVYSNGKLILMNPGLTTRDFLHGCAVVRTGHVHRKLEVRGADTGALLWENDDGVYSYVVGDDRILLITEDRKQMVSLDLDTGKEQWRVPSPPGAFPDPACWWGGGGGGKPLVYCRGKVFATTYEPVVTFKPDDERGLTVEEAKRALAVPEKSETLYVRPTDWTAATMHVFSAKDGKHLWSRPLPVPYWTGGGREFYYLGDYVWAEDYDLRSGDNWRKGYLIDQSRLLGLDPATGEVKKRFDFTHVAYTTDNRKCFGSVATERYILQPAMQLFDTKDLKLYQFYGGRGVCGIGSLPANGLVYKSSLNCACFAHFQTETAFCSDAPPPAGELTGQAPDRLEKGPAFGTTSASAPSSDSDWPTFRHDVARNGSTRTSVPAELEPLWKAQVGGKLSSPVAADGKVLVASIDEHRVAALDAGKGGVLWSYTAGARVDSPPTVYSGLAVFGSRDGYAHCLRLSDGALVWRFRAAPEDRRIMVNGQLESVWPVFGSVLVEKGVVYFAAGRHTETDGGIFLYAAEPRTGKISWEKRLVLRTPFDDRPVRVAEPYTAYNDVLISDGRSLFVDSVEVDLQTHEATTKIRSEGALWGGVAGILYDSCELPFSSYNSGGNWTNWRYVGSMGAVGYRANKLWVARGAIVDGELLAVDGQRVFGVTHVPAEKPIRQFGRIFLVRPTQESQRRYGAGPEVWRQKETAWSVDTPTGTLVKALLVAGDRVFVACRPGALAGINLYTMAMADGPDNGEVRVYSAADGKELGRINLGARPRFDGMAATEGRLYVSAEDGKVLCLGK